MPEHKSSEFSERFHETQKEKGTQIMKKLFLVCSLVVALFGVTAFNAGATLISGAISFSGTQTTNVQDLTLATEFTGFTDVVVSDTGGTGDYAPVLSGQSVVLNTFTFRPFIPNNPLWTFDFAGKTYSFDAILANIAFSNANSLLIEGTGTAHITGFDDTPGTWVYSANNAGETASFSASNVVKGVPEPATMLLLGLGLVGLSGFARKRFRN
jgi:PEP-CTERM motif